MKNKGFTLIEVLIAILIIVTAIGALALIYPGIFTGVSLDAQTLRAWEIAKQEIEALRNTNFATLLGYEASNPNGSVIDANTTRFYYVERMRDSGGSALDDLVRVEVAICYNSGNRVIGEDQNLDGSFSGEDTSSDGKVSSPVSLKTLILKP